MAALKDIELQLIGFAEFDRNDVEKFNVRLKPELTAQPDRQHVGIVDVLKAGIKDLSR